MDDILLTIAIPTFNRLPQLLTNLDVLIPQLTQECKILIVDNNSTFSLIDLNNHIKNGSNTNHIEIVRNKSNIGASSNVARCFELCNTPYIWILGDDDIPMADAIDRVINNIISQPEVSFFNYYCEIYERKHAKKTLGLVNFIEEIDDFSNLLFLSNNIYKTELISKNIQFAYQYAFTLAPQLAILFQSLEEKTTANYVAEKIVYWGKPKVEDRWSVVQQSLGYNSLLELPKIISNGLVTSLAKKLNTGKISLPIIFREVLFLTENQNYNFKTAKYILDQIFYRRLYYYPFYLKILRIPLLFFLRFPKVIMSVFKIKKRLLNKSFYTHNYDPYYN